MTKFALQPAEVWAAVTNTEDEVAKIEPTRDGIESALRQAMGSVSSSFPAAGDGLGNFMADHLRDVDAITDYVMHCAQAVQTCLSIYAAASEEMGNQTDGMAKVANDFRLRQAIAFEPGWGAGILEGRLEDKLNKPFQTFNEDHRTNIVEVSHTSETKVSADSPYSSDWRNTITQRETYTDRVMGDGSVTTNTTTNFHTADLQGSGSASTATVYSGAHEISTSQSHVEVESAVTQVTVDSSHAHVKGR